MNEELKAELQKQQETILTKLSAVMVAKVGQMKRELEEVAHKAHDSQMTELKRIKFSETPSFRKKGHEQQFKNNEQVKLCIAEAEDAVKDKKYDTCLKKLNEGKEQIERRQKLILLADNPSTDGKPCLNTSIMNSPSTKRMQKRSRRPRKKPRESAVTIKSIA